MIKRVSHAAIYVKDVDEAANYYTEVLGFKKLSDDPMNDEGDRWVTVGTGEDGFEIIMQDPKWGVETDPASIEERTAQIGKQPGFIFVTQDIHSHIADLKAKNVEFTMEATEMPWGIQATFKDLYGNFHVLHQDLPQA